MNRIAVLLAFGFSVYLTGCNSYEPEAPSKNSLVFIPQVEKIELSDKGFDLKTIEEVELPAVWNDLKPQISEFNKKHGMGNVKTVEKGRGIVLRFEKVSGLRPEEYRLDVEKKGVYVQASGYGGAFNAFQTWKQLVLHAEKNIIMKVRIDDNPRFGYRGLMIDCSRHFWTVDELKKDIRQMSFFKLNRLHLHLTDNNAWRIEIKSYPKLVKEGTYYKDYPELSGKYYTQDDMREIVAYAEKFNVEVIPEIDLPGHAMGILAAYPELSCRGGHFEVYPEEMPLKDRKRTNENMLCVCNPEVYVFAGKVIDELSGIFHSKLIHLGGDEVPVNIWKASPECQKFYRKEQMKNWGELQDYFTRQMSALTKKEGKKMIGWDEINERHAATPDDIVMVWRNYGFDQAVEALERNVPVIMAPQHGCYFDWGYAGNSTRKVYDWDPVSDKMNALGKNDLVLGGEACLWTERVATQKRVEEMLYPRLTALAEVLWTPQENRAWDDYLKRLEDTYDIMKKDLGINYYVDDAINEEEFEPKKEKPALVRHAWITTNLPNHGNYHVEYIFDGKSNTFYWGGRSLKKGDWYEIKLGEPVKANTITVLTGDSKDYIKHADLLVSEDGKNFTKAARFNDMGEAKADLNGKTIKAVKIVATKNHSSWPVIREVIIK